MPDADLARQREVVDAFFAAARDGDFDALVAVLDPDVVLRADGGSRAGRVAACSAARAAVAEQALLFARLALFVRPALVNGAAGVVVDPRRPAVRGHGLHGRAAGRSSRSTSLADPERLARLDLAFLED